MKLFNYDEKHQRVNAELDLGELSLKELELINKIIDFIDERGITNRYNTLELADSWNYVRDEGDYGEEIIGISFR